MINIEYINAGAGSGKTTILTKILSEKLGKGGYKPSEVILTTFTELAASEFREKSRERLYSDEHAGVAAQLDSATIGTVHSVALNFIKKYWYLIGVSPDMKVMSEDDLQVYISESLGDYVNPDDLDFFRSYSLYFDLRNQGRQNLDYWKDHLLAIIDKVNNYDVDVERSKVDSCKVVEQIFNNQTALNQELLSKFTEALSSQISGYADRPKKYAQPILDGLNSRVVTYATIVKLYKQLTRERAEIGIRNRNGLKAIIGDADYDALVENLKAYQMSSVGDDSPGGMMKKLINILFSIAKRWQDGFNDFKVRRHIIDYNDMERLFLKLLDQPQVEEEIKGTYKLMMVDEFQDSSPIQLKIFDRLSDLIEQSYWVGDPKQSIYGFRGADVELVKEITQQFYDENRDPALHLTHKNLDHSWRTREPLVNLTSMCFTRAFEGVIDKENVELQASRKEDDRFSPSLSHWNCLASDGELFADKVADRIKQLLDSDTIVQNKDDEEFRRIKPGDIAILCRRNDECKTFASALVSKGIPVSFVNSDILQQTEVQLVFALLKFMVDASNKHVRADLLRLLEDVPTQDILQQRLDYMIRLNSQQEDAADEVEKPKDQWLDDDCPLISRLEEFKQAVRNLSVSDLLESIVYGLDLPEVVAKWGDADNRRQNLHTLCALAKEYDEHCLQMGIGASVGGLLTYLSYAEIDSKIDNASEAVKVLTYHKSKGLEWYYVILSSLSHNSLDVNSFIKKNFWEVHELRHPEDNEQYGYVIQFLPPIVNPGNTLLPQPVIDGCQQLPLYRTLQEKERNELRHLLYVGVTRARDYLTTLSHQTNMDALPILHWIKNTGISEGSLDENAAKLWQFDQLTPQYEDITDCPAAEVIQTTTYTRFEYSKDAEFCSEPKYLSPSKLPVMEFALENIMILEDFNCRIEPYNTKEETEAAAGTCIHNIFAVYDPRLSHKENVEKATLIRNGNDMYEVIPDVDKVVTSIEQLYAWLNTTYGEASSIKHEVPFLHPLPGQMVHGEIDLLWYLNANECVLIDFKNFPGGKAAITNPCNKHYAGNYASQLKSYRDVLEASGLIVKDTLIYYSVMGCVVRLEME
jgi:ATP-dependent exoDNAse (exonuclease V) beta subunit